MTEPTTAAGRALDVYRDALRLHVVDADLEEFDSELAMFEAEARAAALDEARAAVLDEFRDGYGDFRGGKFATRALAALDALREKPSHEHGPLTWMSGDLGSQGWSCDVCRAFPVEIKP